VAAAMPFFGEVRCEPQAHNVAHLFIRDYFAAQGEHVRAVVFAAVSGGSFVVTHGGADARHFVGHHAGANAGAINHDSQIVFPAGNGECYGLSEVGVVDGVGGMRAEVLVLDAELGEEAFKSLLHFKSTMIRTNSNFPAVIDRRYRQTFQADVALASEVGSQWSDQSPFPDPQCSADRSRADILFSGKRLLREIDHRRRWYQALVLCAALKTD